MTSTGNRMEALSHLMHWDVVMNADKDHNNLLHIGEVSIFAIVLGQMPLQ